MKEAKLTVAYDGDPSFKPIDGATGLAYAQNTPQPVIRVDADQTYWCVQDGVWFTARRRPARGRSRRRSPTSSTRSPSPARSTTSPTSASTRRRRTSSTSATRRGTWGPSPRATASSSTARATTTRRTSARPSTSATRRRTATAPASPARSATGFAFGFAAGAMIVGLVLASLGAVLRRPRVGLLERRHQLPQRLPQLERRRDVHDPARRVGLRRGRQLEVAAASSFNPYSGRVNAAGSKGWVEADGDYNARRGAASYDPRHRHGQRRGGQVLRQRLRRRLQQQGRQLHVQHAHRHRRRPQGQQRLRRHRRQRLPLQPGQRLAAEDQRRLAGRPEERAVPAAATLRPERPGTEPLHRPARANNYRASRPAGGASRGGGGADVGNARAPARGVRTLVNETPMPPARACPTVLPTRSLPSSPSPR